MNKEIVKAMNKKENSWLKIYGKKFLRILDVIIFFPVYLINGIKDEQLKKLEWDETKADNILSYWIPRIAKYDKETKTFSIHGNSMLWLYDYNIKKVKRKDRKWFNKFHLQIREYLIEKFEIENFTKKVGICSDRWTCVDFILNETK